MGMIHISFIKLEDEDEYKVINNLTITLLSAGTNWMIGC
jgi:hypothetical protein